MSMLVYLFDSFDSSDSFDSLFALDIETILYHQAIMIKK